MSLVTTAELVTYPEYDAAIPRDDAYAVTVTQGDATKPLVVYNRTEKSALNGRTRGGDVNRRFCEFAFAGGAVRVDIRVTQDVACYSVFPSRLNLKHAFKNGVISVWLNKPTLFGIRLNDYDKTILSVFADAPEDPATVPAKGAPGVLYVDRWLDAPGRDGVLTTGSETKEVYIAPGAVLNARLVVKGRGTKVHGRGMVLDPLGDIFRYDQTKNTKRGLLIVGAPDVEVRDIKLIDARTFNFISWWPGVKFVNVKALAAMMCSDGFTLGGRNVLIDGAWLYVGDNALVLSGASDTLIRNVAIGTSCAAIFPQGSWKQPVTLENIDVFRADDGLLHNWHNGVLRRNNKWSEMNTGAARKEPGPQDLQHQTVRVDFTHLSAVDCVLFPHIFDGRNMGTLPKMFSFTDVSVPSSTGRGHWQSIGKTDGVAIAVRNDPKKWLITDNYMLAFTNLWVAGQPVTALPSNAIAGAEAMHLTIARSDAPRGVPLAQNRAEVNWTCPWKRKVPAPAAGANLLEEKWPRQSIWQRAPSWSVKLETENGTDPAARVYSLIQTEKGAGMQTILTDEVVASGNGTYRLSFEAKTDHERPFKLRCRMQSNEKSFEKPVEISGDWKAYSVDLPVEFDLSITELVSLSLSVSEPIASLKLRNLSLVLLR